MCQKEIIWLVITWVLRARAIPDIYRRTRAGRVYKVRERYLRTDVGMGMLVAPSSSLSSGKDAGDDSEENRELQLVDIGGAKESPG